MSLIDNDSSLVSILVLVSQSVVPSVDELLLVVDESEIVEVKQDNTEIVLNFAEDQLSCDRRRLGVRSFRVNFEDIIFN